MGEISLVKERYEHQVMKIPGVVGVGTNPDKSIILLLESKKYINSTPNYIAGIPVKKIVVGKMNILYSNTPLSNRAKVRPIVGGVSISPPENIAGTLGIISEDEVIVTNAHVAAIDFKANRTFSAGTPIYQPAWLDGGNRSDRIGELQIYTNLRNNPTVDGAVCEPTVEFEKMKIMGIGELDGWTVPEKGEVVVKSGRTTGVTSSYVITNDATIKMGGYPWGYSIFKECIITIPAIASSGDSGSILVSDNHVAGLVFGGSDVATAANRIDNVIPELGVCFGRRYKPAEENVFISSISDVWKALVVAAAPTLGIVLLEERLP